MGRENERGTVGGKSGLLDNEENTQVDNGKI